MNRIERGIELLFDTFMSTDIANEKALRQNMCTMSQEDYAAEHIGEENQYTELFGHIKMGTELDVDTGKEEPVLFGGRTPLYPIWYGCFG